MSTTTKDSSGIQLLEALRESSSNCTTCECGLPILREGNLSEGETHTCECGSKLIFRGKTLGETQWEGPTKE